MADATPTRTGQLNGTGDTQAGWLKVFGGEVLTAYETAVRLKPTVRTRTIATGRSAQFPATWDAVARYHTPGSEINGQTILNNEVTVTLDDLLIADVFVALIDELKTHWDVRGPYAEALGRALALFEDRQIAQTVVAAARGASLFTGDTGGTIVTQANVSGTADFGASGSDLISALNLGKQRMDEAEVPVDTMPINAVLRPVQWYLIANSDKNLNRDFNQEGASIARQVLKTVSDIMIWKSNAPLFGFNATPYNASTNPTGIVAATAGGPIGTPAPRHGGLPFDYPTKYQYDLRNTRGLMWAEPAVAYLSLLGLTMEAEYDVRRQGTLMLAKMACGMGPLRTKCAVELRTV